MDRMPHVSIILFAILFSYTCLLFYLLAVLLKQNRRTSTLDRNDSLPGVSIVIPFRNEAENLERLILSLQAQDYAGPIEILLVNDNSEDDYKTALNGRAWNRPVRTIDSRYSPDRRLTSKQQALDLGIKTAAHEWIASTDADMQLDPAWLSSLMKTAIAGADLVFGHTVITATDSLFGRFQAVQLETLFAVALAFDRAGITGSCMGNNMLLSRKAYLDAGGFDSIGYSIVEDCKLLAAFKKKRFRTASTDPFLPSAATLPVPTIGAYRQQQMRWAAGGFSASPAVFLCWLLLTCQNLIFVLTFFVALPFPIVSLSYGTMLLTWTFVLVAFRRMKSSRNALLWILFYPALLIESLAVIVSLVFAQPIVWKGRRL
jgi:cellulose synthase/poly-beta-1,6-N-acetylglucosamine synthase-like glycosyltransferase